MNKKSRWVTVLAVGGVLAAVLLFFYTLYHALWSPSPDRSQSSRSPSVYERLSQRLGVNPLVQLYRESALVFVLTWKDIPLEATHIAIYRSLKGQQRWAIWKTVVIPAGASAGSLEIVIESAEDLTAYDLFFQLLSQPPGAAAPVVLWTSPATAVIPHPPPVQVVSVRVNQSVSQPGAALPPTPAALPPPSPSLSPSPPPTQPSFPPGWLVYYRPDGSLSGALPPRSENFWVQHVNKNIEIGWQQLPLATAAAIISRAPSADGPWTQLLVQERPVTTIYTFQILDNTLGTPFYYRFEAVADGQVIASYGPLLLEPL